MNTVGHFIGISKQTEVLFLILFGICCTIFDASLFNLNSNLYKVWEMQMDRTKFTDSAQLYVKYLLSTIVLVRTFTVHLYLAFYIVMLWPAIFEERPGLLLPWLIVGAIKCLAMGAIASSTGLYICLSYTFSKPACWDFLISQLIDQGPSVYMWFCVLSYYRDLKTHAICEYPFHQTTSAVFGLAERRRRARSLFANSKFENSFDDRRQLISVSTIDNIINQLNISLHRGTSRSLDSLLDLMAAEAEKEEILEMNDETTEVDDSLTVAERTAKILKLSPSDIKKAKNKSASDPNTFQERQIRHQNTYPLLKKSLSDIRRKPKVSRKPSDDLSLIPSETEVRTIGLSDSFEKLPKSGIQNTFKTKSNIISKLPRPIKEDLNAPISTINDKCGSNLTDQVEIKEIKPINKKIFPDDLISPDRGDKLYSMLKNVELKKCASASTLTSDDPKLSVATQKSDMKDAEENIPEIKVISLEVKEYKLCPAIPIQKFEIKDKSSLPVIIKPPTKSETVELKRYNAMESDFKPKLREEAKSYTPLATPVKAATQSGEGTKISNQKPIAPKVIPKVVKYQPPKSKSQGKTDFIMTAPQQSTFKYDGYTLDYMEKQKKIASNESKKRPCSSGV